MIGLADCNNFFVSCERTVRPELEGRPVVVLSNNDGCVVARSNEAKRMGIKMGQPAFEIKDLITKGQLVVLSGNHILYREISIRIHDIFRRFAPATLDYSVDEAFLLMNGIPDHLLQDIGVSIRDECMRLEHIPVTIGFAPSKTLAKVATEVGKKGGNGVVVLSDEKEIESVLKKIPISDLWGIGRRLAKRLYMSGIYTIGDFAAADRMWVRGKLGVNGERSWLELHGVSCIELEHVGRRLQDSVSETRTFPIDVDDYDYLRSRVAIYCAHLGKRLRLMGGQCSEITVMLRTNRFHTESGIYTPTATMPLETPTFDTPEIVSVATSLLDAVYDPRFSYKRAGVILSRITPATDLLPSLFDDYDGQIEARRKSKKLMKTLDKLNMGAGPSVVRLASEITKGHVGHNDGYSSSFGAPKPE